MEDIVRTRLKQVVARYGRDLITNPRLPEILRENLGSEHKLEASVLNAAVQFGIPQRLCTLEPGNLTSTTLSNMAAGMAATGGLKEELAASAVAVWAEALGITPVAGHLFHFVNRGEGRAELERAVPKPVDETVGGRAYLVERSYLAWMIVSGTILLCWYGASAIFGPLLLPYPHLVAEEMFRLATSTKFLPHIGATTLSVLTGFAVGVALFFALCNVLTRFGVGLHLVHPAMGILLMLPPAVLIPLDFYYIDRTVGSFLANVPVVAYASLLAALISIGTPTQPLNWRTQVLAIVPSAISFAWATAIALELYVSQMMYRSGEYRQLGIGIYLGNGAGIELYVSRMSRAGNPGTGISLTNAADPLHVTSFYAAVLLVGCAILLTDVIIRFAFTMFVLDAHEERS
jgi:hypothetical protein